MDPITALATFNAACAVVKEAKNHAGDIVSIFKGIGDMMSARKAVEQAVKNDPQKADLELYAAHAQMEQQWKEIVEMLKWSGHWDKYLKFCSDRRDQEKQQRLEQVRLEQKRKQKIKEILLIALVTVSVLSAVGIFFWLIWLVKNRGIV
jgi:uncharacterized protein YqhQ